MLIRLHELEDKSLPTAINIKLITVKYTHCYQFNFLCDMFFLVKNSETFDVLTNCKEQWVSPYIILCENKL